MRVWGGGNEDKLGFRQCDPFRNPNHAIVKTEKKCIKSAWQVFMNELIEKLALDLFFYLCCAVICNLASYNLYYSTHVLLLWLWRRCFQLTIILNDKMKKKSSFEKLPMPMWSAYALVFLLSVCHISISSCVLMWSYELLCLETLNCLVLMVQACLHRYWWLFSEWCLWWVWWQNSFAYIMSRSWLVNYTNTLNWCNFCRYLTASMNCEVLVVLDPG